ncbi:hypothetical protein PG984_001081 [Apiospora sp. TS-2023a]
MAPRYYVAKRGLLLDQKLSALVWSLADLVTIRLRRPQAGRMLIESPGHNPSFRGLVAASVFSRHPPALLSSNRAMPSRDPSKSVLDQGEHNHTASYRATDRKLTPATPTHPAAMLPCTPLTWSLTFEKEVQASQNGQFQP